MARHGRTRLPLSPLQGGISDELSLSAYVTAAMLELGLSPTVRMTPSSPKRLVEGVQLFQATSQPNLGATGHTGQELESVSDAHGCGLVPDSAPVPGPDGELSPAVPGGFGRG